MSNDRAASERRCALRMRQIEQERFPLDEEMYSVDEVAERYDVHRDTVYKGIRAQSPLFPEALRKTDGPKAWLYISPEAIAACDRRRIAFYKTTPSWHELFGEGTAAAPARRSARSVIGAVRGLPKLSKKA